jgi:hypothetical protein
MAADATSKSVRNDPWKGRPHVFEIGMAVAQPYWEQYWQRQRQRIPSEMTKHEAPSGQVNFILNISFEVEYWSWIGGPENNRHHRPQDKPKHTGRPYPGGRPNPIAQLGPCPKTEKYRSGAITEKGGWETMMRIMEWSLLEDGVIVWSLS